MIPLFYRELLEYFQELRSNCEDPLQREFILWNNKDINVENKSVFWKSWRDKNVLFVQDLLNNQGNYLSPQKFSNKYNIKVNFLQYYQIITAIPASLKSYAFTHLDLGKLNSFSENVDFQISKGVSLNLRKLRANSFTNCLQRTLVLNLLRLQHSENIVLWSLTSGSNALKAIIKSLEIIS